MDEELYERYGLRPDYKRIDNLVRQIEALIKDEDGFKLVGVKIDAKTGHFPLITLEITTTHEETS